VFFYVQCHEFLDLLHFIEP